MSFAAPATQRVEAIARHTQELGHRVAGRLTPMGGPLELVPDLRQQLRAADAIVVLFGADDADELVRDEIEWSYEDGKGLVGVRLDPAATTPELLYEAGAEILDWSDGDDRARFAGAIRAANRGAALMEKARQQGSGSGAPCARPKPPQRD